MPENIECAAIKYKGRIYIGVRHESAIYKACLGEGHYPRRYTDGFLTSFGRFVSRQEAAVIAWDARQTRVKYDFLYSENLILFGEG